MIQANELRVGNKVQYGKGFIFDVVSIHDDGTVYCDFDGNEGDVWEFNDKNPCNPIPLTKENLLKFGFKDDGNGWLSLGRVCLFNIDSNNTVIRVYPSKDQLQLKINSLHHLQNVLYYFAGLELGGKL